MHSEIIMEQARAVFKHDGEESAGHASHAGHLLNQTGLLQKGAGEPIDFLCFGSCEAMGKNKLREVL